MKISIVIVNYNGKHLLEKNLLSVVENGYENFDIVVVDNASEDGSIEYLKKKFPFVKIVESKENLGFGRGNNLGVKENPHYDAYLFLNNDISVPKSFLDNLVKELQKDGVGAVGPKVLYSKENIGSEKRVINSAGIEVDSHYMAYDRYDKEEDNPKYNVIEEVDALMGGAFLVKKEVFEKVGGFNPNMFLYYEDIDLSLRIRDLGYKLYYVGTSEVYHDHMASSKSLGTRKRNIMNMQNRFRSIQSRKGLWVAIWETIWYLLNWLIWKMIYSRRITLKEFLKEK
ncbi:MAG TPA: glycosyltransferase family 2 protein [Candidatus Dojkabacteria bacterium]|nr:glycosyltransferase family 2 protein [Candidatus Dojkabacteria bacterium]